MYKHSQHGSVDVISGDAALAADAVEGILELFEQRAEHGQPHVVFDLGQTPYFDSTGLELLLDLRDRCTARGGALVVAAPNALCRDVLHVTRLDREFDLYDDPVSAAGSFAR